VELGLWQKLDKVTAELVEIAFLVLVLEALHQEMLEKMEKALAVAVQGLLTQLHPQLKTVELALTEL
jgi:hypothetical protein